MGNGRSGLDDGRLPIHPAGSWVEIEVVILTAAERIDPLPSDTRQVDFVGRSRGLLTAPARIGDHVAVRTLADRIIEGRLRTLAPRHPVDFGEPIPELLAVGRAARERLEGDGR
ncbi:MAG: 2-amino-4-ketopentanoate thiolase [Chloroflexi bacterium]|nr:2-amino-4-ketopentanoate thiolase [Chloroflexota bacterium]